MQLISRRKLITVGAAAGATTLLLPLFAEIGFGDAVVQAATLGVSDFLAVAPAANPSSAVILNRHFPGLHADSGFQPLLPLAFLVTNVGSRDILAYSSHWSLSTSSGTKEKTILHYFHPRGGNLTKTHWGVKGNRTRFTGTMPAIKSGASRLVTPFFNWSPSYYSKNKSPNWTELLRQRSRPGFAVSDLANSGATVTMKVDAAVTSDFTAVGPRADNLAKIIRVTRNAEHDEAVAVLWYISAGASSAQIKSHLYSHASGLAFDITPETDLYFRVRQRQAKVLLRRLKYARWDQFLRTLNYMGTIPKTSMTAISAV